jgi:hypothetical protein
MTALRTAAAQAARLFAGIPRQAAADAEAVSHERRALADAVGPLNEWGASDHDPLLLGCTAQRGLLSRHLRHWSPFIPFFRK